MLIMSTRRVQTLCSGILRQVVRMYAYTLGYQGEIRYENSGSLLHDIDGTGGGVLTCNIEKLQRPSASGRHVQYYIILVWWPWRVFRSLGT